MKGTTRSIMAEIRLSPPAMVTKQVTPSTTAEIMGSMPKLCSRAPVTDSVCTQQVQGPRTKQATDSTTAPRFHPRAFFMTKERSHIYSSMDSLYLTRYLCPKIISQALVDMPSRLEIHIQNSAPGPPDTTAVATPPMFPTPMVLAMAVHAAAKPEMVPAPSLLRNIRP